MSGPTIKFCLDHPQKLLQIFQAGLDREYMWDPGRLGVGVEIPSIIFSFVSLDAKSSILIPPSIVPYVNALDQMITVDISFNPQLILAFYKYS